MNTFLVISFLVNPFSLISWSCFLLASPSEYIVFLAFLVLRPYFTSLLFCVVWIVFFLLSDSCSVTFPPPLLLLFIPIRLDIFIPVVSYQLLIEPPFVVYYTISSPASDGEITLVCKSYPLCQFCDQPCIKSWSQVKP